MLDAGGIKYEREYRFHPTRKWRFDFAIPEHKIAVEVQGGIYIHGRHNRGIYLESEYEKMCQAAILGWAVMPVTSKMILDGIIIEYINEAIENRR